MAYDGIVLYAVTDSLNQLLLNARVDKIQQPQRHEIIIHLHNQGCKYKLLLSGHPQNSRLHLTNTIKPNPQTPPTFCMVLRKHLLGSRLKAIKQLDLERVVRLEFEAMDELGNLVPKIIVAELMGKHSNIFLINEKELVLDCLKRVTEQQSQQREAYPGVKYVQPPVLGKKNPLTCSEEAFRLIMLNSSLNEKVTKVLLNNFSGFSRRICQGLLTAVNLPSDSLVVADLGEYELRLLWNSFHQLCTQLKTGSFSPNILLQQQRPCDFLAVDLFFPTEDYRCKFADINTVVDDYFNWQEQYQRYQATSDKLRKIIREAQEKLVIKVDIQDQILGSRDQLEKYKITGEVLTAFLYQLKRGLSEVELPNIYDPDQQLITIALNPEISPAENAQRYFKKYNKLKTAINFAEQQKEQCQSELAYLDSVENSLDNCNALEDLNEVSDELKEHNYIKEKSTVRKKGSSNQPEFHLACYKSADGIDIIVGKNNRQNDYLTFKLARSNDLWLHSKDIPGSHVIVRCGGKNVPEKTLRQAAALAAYFSKARNSSNVPVDYTKVCNVQKPRGAKPGFVNYFHQKTIWAEPKEP